MQLLKSGNYTTTLAVNPEDAVLLAEACEALLTETTDRGTEEKQQRLENAKALFEAVALLGAIQYAYPLDKLQEVALVLADLGLEDFLDRRELAESPTPEA
jgi:hypothetical protein